MWAVSERNANLHSSFLLLNSSNRNGWMPSSRLSFRKSLSAAVVPDLGARVSLWSTKRISQRHRQDPRIDRASGYTALQLVQPL
jgi:hypothetical protein